MICRTLVPFWGGSKKPGVSPSGADSNVSVQALISHLKAFSVVRKNMYPQRWDLPRLS